jgi:caa(3)-type oxidase subunit IV
MTANEAPQEHGREPGEPQQVGAGGAHSSSGKRYIYAWLSLLVLTGLSFAVDGLHLGSISTTIALGVALLKASIVFVVFMHLDREPFPIRFVAALNVAWVLLLCLGIAADVSPIAGHLTPGR